MTAAILAATRSSVLGLSINPVHFVVRELAGPFAVDTGGEARLQHLFSLDPRWKSGDLHVAAFVQSERSGDVLQALAMPYCR